MLLFKTKSWLAYPMAVLLLATTANAELRELTPVADQPPAPDFTLTDTTGVTHTLSDYRGKVVIVNFWATWCVPCRKEMPSMQRAWEKIREQGVMMLAVNWKEEAKTVKLFTDSLPPMDFPLLLGGDDAMTETWGVKGLPTTFVVDPEGRIVYKVVGERDWDDAEVLAKVLALKAG